MRILVLSDSHGRAGMLLDIIERHAEADMIIFLGDGEDDFESAEYLMEGRPVFRVAGNGDFYSRSSVNGLIEVVGKRIYFTHGHEEMVKYGTERLLRIAKAKNADIALYGHSHNGVSSFEDGVYLFNPGAVMNGCYGVVDITKAGIVPVNMKLR